MNVDLVVEVAEIPLAGETVVGSNRQEFFGGKGANQAVAIARLGGKVGLAGCVGAEDGFGASILANLRREGVDCEFALAVPGQPTGVALVTVSKRGGENTVIVVPGANFALRVDHLPIDFSNYSTVLCQNEVPLEVTLEAFRRAKRAGRRTFWNPAPAPLVDVRHVLEHVDVLCVNETEAERISGGEADLELAIARLAGWVQHCVIITLGSKGCLWRQRGEGATVSFPAAQCAKPVVDTTGAGDCFCGSLVWGLEREGGDFGKAIRLANQVAALSVQTMGAQNSYPRLDELGDKH